MSRRETRRLSAEDRILWNRVARTAVPLAGKVAEPEDEAPAKAPAEASKDSAGPPPPPSAAPESMVRRTRLPQRLDEPTRTKLARGRLPIGGRVDLHGMTQAEAHDLLLSFLRRARESGLRHVLVITGKGSTGDGVLRHAVPKWLATSPFADVVSGHDRAARQHGGEGAIYVRLRRQAAGGR